MVVELSVIEQRYQAVLAVVQDGWEVTEVARRLRISRQSVHTAERRARQKIPLSASFHTCSAWESLALLDPLDLRQVNLGTARAVW